MRSTTAWLAIGAMMVLAFAGCRGGSSGSLASRMWPWGRGGHKAPQQALASNSAPPTAKVTGPPLPSQTTTPSTLGGNSPYIAGAAGAAGAAGQAGAPYGQTLPASSYGQAQPSSSYEQTQPAYATTQPTGGQPSNSPYSSYGAPANSGGYAQNAQTTWNTAQTAAAAPTAGGYPSTPTGYGGQGAVTTNPYTAANTNPAGQPAPSGYGANSPYREPVQSFAGATPASYQETGTNNAGANVGPRYSTAAAPTTNGGGRYPNYGQTVAGGPESYNYPPTPPGGAVSSTSDPTMPPLGQTGYNPGNMSDNKPIGAGAYQSPYQNTNTAADTQQPSPYLPGSTSRFAPGGATTPTETAPQNLAAPQPSNVYR